MNFERKMENASFSPVSRVAICGGTHGNEMTGMYVVREMQRQEADQTGSVSITTVISNPRAVEVCRRYTETDLNRCFTKALLSSPITDSTPYEVRRAQEMNALLGPKESQEAVDLLCDLHNTTANMGMCLIFYSLDWLTLHIYKYIQDNDFKLLQPGDPMFLSFSGETVKYEGEDLHPLFINECAYYEKKIAFHLAKRITVTLPSISYPVRRHAAVVFAVTPRRPQKQSSCHHLQGEGDEGEVEGPAQRAHHPCWGRGILLEQIHARQEAADGAQSAQT
ncbi:hypothetical protein F7725_005715 [Dissostichus mawsoni]|uniref:Aspartoacylase n=1 Tax=Dissostichus mawsoni TaxID=36200 RepID=A0A7J5YSH0_DISMA|nr:hypothetical protein F7725_005715 [Dissostichus mawsoni]